MMVGRGGFEPPKSLTADLQSAPFGHSGTLPYILSLPTFIKKAPESLFNKLSGAWSERWGDRTPDNLIKSQVLYRLS